MQKEKKLPNEHCEHTSRGLLKEYANTRSQTRSESLKKYYKTQDVWKTILVTENTREDSQILKVLHPDISISLLSLIPYAAGITAIYRSMKPG